MRQLIEFPTAGGHFLAKFRGFIGYWVPSKAPPQDIICNKNSPSAKFRKGCTKCIRIRALVHVTKNNVKKSGRLAGERQGITNQELDSICHSQPGKELQATLTVQF